MKKIVSAMMAILMISSVVLAADIPASEYEHLTTTRYTEYLTNYHMTLEETIEDGLKGGEGFQCMYAYERHDKYPDYVARSYDTCGIYYSKDGAKTWYPEESYPGYTGDLSFGVCGLEYHPDNPEILFSYRWGVASETIAGGLYVSTDGGKTSRQIYALPRKKVKNNYDGWIKFGEYDEKKGKYPLYIVESNQDNPDRAGLYVSWDWDNEEKWNYNKPESGGITFERIAFGDAEKDGLIRRFTVSYDKKVMVASIGWKRDEQGNWSIKGAEGGMYASFDQGKTWLLRNKGIEEFVPSAIGIDPLNNEHWIMSPHYRWEKDLLGRENGYIMLYETWDSGETWQKMNVEDWNVPIKKEVEEQDQGKDWFGNPNGIASLNINKAGDTMVEQIIISFPNTKDGTQAILISMEHSCWPYRISFDGGKNFGYINDDARHYLGKDETGWYGDPWAISEAVPDEYLVGIWKSNDAGEDFHWNDSKVSGKLCTSFIWDSNGQLRRLGGFDIGIFETVEGYEGDFPPIVPHRRNNAFANATCADLVKDPNDDNHIWGIAGTTSYSMEEILVETDNNFVNSQYYVNMQMRRRAKADSNNVSDYPHYRVQYAPNDDQVIFSGLFYSNDNGKTWRESEYIIRAVDAFNSKVCYAMGDDVNNNKNQILVSYDGAKTWQSTGVSITNVRDCVVADKTEPYVVWVGEHNSSTTNLHRVDLKTGTIKTIGAAQGLRSNVEKRGLQLMELSYSDLYPNVMHIYGMDYYGQRGYNFISYNGGESWISIPGAPAQMNGSFGQFHPTKTQLWIGGPMGIWVFDYGKYAKDNNIELTNSNQ